MSEIDSMEMVEITRKEYDSLMKQIKWLTCLEDAGVDNWQDIDFAYEVLEEWED